MFEIAHSQCRSELNNHPRRKSDLTLADFALSALPTDSVESEKKFRRWWKALTHSSIILIPRYGRVVAPFALVVHNRPRPDQLKIQIPPFNLAIYAKNDSMSTQIRPNIWASVWDNIAHLIRMFARPSLHIFFVRTILRRIFQKRNEGTYDNHTWLYW